MNGGRTSDAAAVAALALSVHRSPAAHADLLHGTAPLPSSISILLRLAGGTSPHDLDSTLTSLATEAELREAALFFIEHVLFQRDATHYRVLGLNKSASGDQIKEHHRLLMRLFHPDRESQADERREQYATRTNLAYNTLRDADLRARYDDTLKPPPVTTLKMARPAPGVMRRRMHEPESFWSVRIYPLFMRYLPQWVLAGTALVSVSIVGMVYLDNQAMEVSRTGASSTAVAVAEKPALPAAVPEAKVDISDAKATTLDDLVAQFERKIAAAEKTISPPAAVDEAAATPSVQAAPPKPIAVTHAPSRPVQPVLAKPIEPNPAKPIVAATAKPAVAVQAGRAETAPVKATQAALEKPVRKLAKAATPAPVVAAQVAPAVAPSRQAIEPMLPVVAAATPSFPQAVESPPPPMPDPNKLLARFLEAYERGDVQACMGLLDEGLRADAGGKPELRREYDALFRNTDLRHIKILNMNWSREGDSIRGEGRYQAKVMRKGETLLRSEDGYIRVELVRRGGTALINELHYDTNSPS